jgi:hypothetical protein
MLITTQHARILRTKLATSEAGAQAIDVERCAKHAINLLLEEACGLIAAQVGACNAVVTTEAVCAQRHLHAHQEVVSSQSFGEVLGHVIESLSEVARLALGGCLAGYCWRRFNSLQANISKVIMMKHTCVYGPAKTGAARVVSN